VSPIAGKPKEARLPLLAQSLERWHHVTEHLLNAERFSASSFGGRVVQMENVDPFETKSRQTAFE
jgi:hypothetical protein